MATQGSIIPAFRNWGVGDAQTDDIQTQRQQGNLIFQNQETRLRIYEVHISSLFIPGVREIWPFLHRSNANAKSSHSNCNTEAENNINAESNANAVSDMGM
jgi:hypothetical protein